MRSLASFFFIIFAHLLLVWILRDQLQCFLTRACSPSWRVVLSSCFSSLGLACAMAFERALTGFLQVHLQTPSLGIVFQFKGALSSTVCLVCQSNHLSQPFSNDGILDRAAWTNHIAQSGAIPLRCHWTSPGKSQRISRKTSPVDLTGH